MRQLTASTRIHGLSRWMVRVSLAAAEEALATGVERLAGALERAAVAA